jgi:hypothetical protein
MDECMAHWFEPIHLIIQIDGVMVPKFYNIFPLHLWYSRPLGMSFEFTIDAKKRFKIKYWLHPKKDLTLNCEMFLELV